MTVDPLSGLHCHQRGFSGGAVAKNPPAKAGDSRDMGSILGSGRFPLEQEMATHSGILAGKVPRTEGPSGQPSMWSQ